MLKKFGLWKWLLRPVGLAASVSAAVMSSGATTANAEVETSEQMGTIEELTVLILGSSREDEVLEAFCLLQDLSEDAANDVAADYIAGYPASGNDEPVAVSFDSCDMSGSARLVVI